MSRLRQLIREIHRRSLWQVLGIYLAGSWMVLQVVDTLVESIGLPNWFPPVAFALLVVGLPVVVATAFVQEGAGFSRPAEGAPAEAKTSGGSSAGESSGRVERILTWRNALLGGILAFALWGVAAATWLVLGDAPWSSAGDEGKSIAVLPFDNMSGEPENEYFSDGITDDIITQLSKLSDLKVISRTSSMRYKETDKALRQIGEELGVAAILEGGVRRQDDRVRINAQLIDARTDEHLWAETYDRRLTDIFEIQSDVALRIAAELQARLTETERERIGTRWTDSPDAYELYLRGRKFWYDRTELDSAIAYFDRSLDLDPDFALPYAGLADVYVIYANRGLAPPRETIPLLKRYARRAIAIDSLLGEPRAALAWALFTFDYDWEGADREFRKALELSPSYATGHYWYSYFLFRRRQVDEGLERGQRAMQLDPRSPAIAAGIGGRLYSARRYGVAEEWLARALELDDGYPSALSWLGLIRLEQGRAAEGISLAERGAAGLAGQMAAQALLAYAYAAGGRREQALALLQEFETSEGYVPPAWIAATHAALGDTEEAFQWLETAYRERDDWLASIALGAWMDPLREDARFSELLIRIGLS